MYRIKEIFHSLQGEGTHAGRSAIFVRFSGCNMWNGREEDRAKGRGACAKWCDTDFVGTDGENGGEYATGEEVFAKVLEISKSRAKPLIVFTGGEPFLQIDDALLAPFYEAGMLIHVETNGTVKPKTKIYVPDWITLSPKVGRPLEISMREVSEVKLVASPENVEGGLFKKYEQWGEENGPRLFVQPLAEGGTDNAPSVAEFCIENPAWRMSVQMHKLLELK